MAAVPLPDVPCVRVRCTWNIGVNGEGSIRFYLSYSGSAPTPANCISLADDIASAWGTDISPLHTTYFTLNEVDVLDIATDSGASGQWTGSTEGSRSGFPLPDQVAVNVEFDIARRYRGGKPRMFLPPGTDDDGATRATWTPDYVGDVNSGVEAFFAAIAALSIGAMGTLAHVNLSYYKGFTIVTLPSGRSRNVPTYRPTALHDDVEGYATKVVYGSQKRRRTSTTP